MSRKKDIALLAPLRAKIFRVPVQEARKSLMRMPAKRLRRQRLELELAKVALCDPEFQDIVDTIRTEEGPYQRLLAIIGVNVFSQHTTVQ